MLKKTGLLLKFSGDSCPFFLISLFVVWLVLWVMRLHPRVLEPMSDMTGHAEN
jgi:hypothetical protein